MRVDKGEPNAAGELLQLAGLAYYRASDLVHKVLAAAREQLNMEVAFVSEVRGTDSVSLARRRRGVLLL